MIIRKKNSDQGPVVQSIVRLKKLRDQSVKCFRTSLPNTLIYFAEKMREAFAQKRLTFFSIKNTVKFEILKFDTSAKR